jgi:hypothetical protein
MMGLFPSRKAVARRPLDFRSRLLMEVLEDRTCLSAPQLSFSLASAGGRMVTITGQVTDERPDASTVTLGGVVSGTVTPNADGSFSLVREASALGPVTGSVLDDEALSGFGTPQELQGSAPDITNLHVSYGAPGTVTVTGRVVDDNPAGLLVSFSGALRGLAVTSFDGWFAATFNHVNPGEFQAGVTNTWGLESVELGEVQNQPPVITEFYAARENGNVWRFEGRVQDEDPESCVINFGGLFTLDGKSVGVDENGWFSFSIELAPGESGIATAVATDAFGLHSELEETPVDPT